MISMDFPDNSWRSGEITEDEGWGDGEGHVVNGSQKSITKFHHRTPR